MRWLYRILFQSGNIGSLFGGPGGAADAILLEDGTSGILLEDGVSYLLME